jgi:hypothetical protein
MLGSMLGLGRRVAQAAGASAFALGMLTPCLRAAAHGEPPLAHAVIRADSSGPILIKLGTGFALRQAGGRFRFVCPALWGGELTAPAAALPDGRVVVGANAGLMLLATDGSMLPHPDPLAAGLVTELVRSQDKVFALRYSAGRSEVLEVDAEHVRVVWSDSDAWYSLAALHSSLVLLRASNASVEQLALSFDGTERERRTGSALRTVDYAFVRPLDDEAYALLLFQTTPELGRLEQGSFVRVAQAGSSIAGPIATPEGPLLALDGQLTRMQGQMLAPLADAAYVSCLEQGEFANYACTRTGLARVGAQGVGEELFALTSLVPPDLTLPHDEKARARCDYQWQDMRFDLIALGMPLRFEGQEESDAGRADAGVTVAAEAGVAPPDAGSELAAADASEEPSAVVAKGSSHCALARVGQRRETPWSGLAWAGLCSGLAAELGRRRRR